MLKFTSRSLIVFAGVVIAMLALTNAASADECKTEPAAAEQATVG